MGARTSAQAFLRPQALDLRPAATRAASSGACMRSCKGRVVECVSLCVRVFVCLCVCMFGGGGRVERRG